MKKGPQKCSAHGKVCLSALRSHFESQIRLTLYFQNLCELCGSVGYWLQKGDVWLGRLKGSKLC